jgi:hypothetical protein
MEEIVNDLQIWYAFHVKENKSTWTKLMENKTKNNKFKKKWTLLFTYSMDFE